MSGCAGATGNLWDTLHAAALDALSSAHDDYAVSLPDASQRLPESQSQSDMDLDFMMSPSRARASMDFADAEWSSMSSPRAGASAVHDAKGCSSSAAAALEHPLQHALMTLSAVRCTSMRTCRIGLARSADAAGEGPRLLVFVSKAAWSSGRATHYHWHDESRLQVVQNAHYLNPQASVHIHPFVGASLGQPSASRGVRI